ncbi:exo-alpha-sialidase [Thiorhodococcus mannitoliphagus]|uniref:Exo-alpha-sialidase n=1 Tax=Thiorhodococcus mannitoliphagus TaxID=329406 RepID=A0A6P1DU60_9GAMM|nr:sialidase family protein [Thiorhodococcus mannitoliphagus]NEX19235.1 exo-alpha-sialidase [Thiorhodococcus mannitoliphagus]
MARPLCLVGSLAIAFAVQAAEPVEALTAHPLGAKSQWDYRVDEGGRLWLAYYDANRRLRLRYPDGREQSFQPEERGQAPSGLGLEAMGGGVDLLWRDKMPKKGLYLVDSTLPDMSPLEIGAGTEPLARIRAEADGAGLLHLLWYGEETGEPTGSPYNLYHRTWHRSSESLSPTELVMPGIYPSMVTDETGGVMVFSWLRDASPKRIVARYRPASGGGEADQAGFGPAVTISEIATIAPLLESFRSGSRWFVLWVGQSGEERADYRLEGAYSDDTGKSWTRFGFEGLEAMSIASLQRAADGSGHIILAISALERKDGVKSKRDVFLLRSEDNGTTWSKPEPLRRPAPADAGATTDGSVDLRAFHAKDPSVAFGSEPGQVVVVWEDWRNIRGSLYASLSKDYGRTWAASNVRLPVDPGKNFGMDGKLNGIYKDGSHFAVLAGRYENDTLSTRQIVRVGLSWPELADYTEPEPADLPTKAERVEAVRKRAQAFWTAVMNDDYKDAYALQDPFFRARMSMRDYLTKTGMIKYESAKIDSIDINGARAELQVKLRASIPSYKLPTTGEVVSKPEKEVTVSSVWLWVDGDWYKEFRIESKDIVFTVY